MAISRLQIGFLAEGEPIKETESMLEKPALFVYPGTFQSMDGEVEITQEKIQKLVDNHNSLWSRMKRMASGDVPLRDCPPLQLDHQATATNTVGRVIGPLELREIEIDGEKLMGVHGVVRVLGKENVEKVKDGRWIHLSVGADFDEGKLSELSITPFPAAAHASLLSKGHVKVGDKFEVDWDGPSKVVVVDIRIGKALVKRIGKTGANDDAVWVDLGELTVKLSSAPYFSRMASESVEPFRFAAGSYFSRLSDTTYFARLKNQ